MATIIAKTKKFIDDAHSDIEQTISSATASLHDAINMVDLSVVYKIGNNEEISGVIDFSYIGLLPRDLARDIANTLAHTRSGDPNTTIIQDLLEALSNANAGQNLVACAISNGFDRGMAWDSDIGNIVGTKGNILLSDGSLAIVTSAYFPTRASLHITYTDFAGNNHEAFLGWDNFTFVAGYINTTHPI